MPNQLVCKPIFAILPEVVGINTLSEAHKLVHVWSTSNLVLGSLLVHIGFPV
jgi:hypothetical protein